jgi:hypothetical protein
VHARFARRVADGYRAMAGDVPEPPAYIFRAAVGAIHELVIDRLLKQGAETLPELLGPILEIELRLLSAAGPGLAPQR